jgi:hypothetical protein
MAIRIICRFSSEQPVSKAESPGQRCLELSVVTRRFLVVDPMMGRAPMRARSPLLKTSSARDGNGLSTGVRGRLLDIRM